MRYNEAEKRFNELGFTTFKDMDDFIVKNDDDSDVALINLGILGEMDTTFMSFSVLEKDVRTEVFNIASKLSGTPVVDREPKEIATLIPKIEKWSADRHLDKNDPEKQLEKLKEEVSELIEAYETNNFGDVNSSVDDSVGDIMVVLIIFCQQTGLNIRDCLEQAYDEIKDRKGKTINGKFVKEQDNENN